MFNGKHSKLTDLTQIFLRPVNSTQRQYEALRAFFVEQLPSAEVARRFGYSPGSFRVLVHQFRQNPHRPFFLAPARGPQQAPKKDPVRQMVIAARKENLSIYDISRLLQEEGHQLSPVSVSLLLKQEGFARLPRRGDEERLAWPQAQPAPKADVGQLDLSPRQVRTQFAGLFLFIPYLSSLAWGKLLVDFPGSKKIPAAQAVRSLLGLKLFGSARHSHVMSEVLDEGPGLWAGLNRIPKRSFLTEYSCRIDPTCYPKLMRRWTQAMRSLGLPRGDSLDLDFHTIPFHGEEALVQKHYVSKRSRRQKGLLAFVAQDAETHVFCYGNAQVRKEVQNEEIIQFARYWRQQNGRWPAELVFDSKLTTYANLGWLEGHQIAFITLRRRTRQMLQEVWNRPLSAWRTIELEGVGRAYRHPRILDEKIGLKDYPGRLRQIVATDLGHEEPTFLLTNQLTCSAAHLIKRYARRMLIENNLQDGIDFFHMDALSSAVPMKVDCDLQLTLMASSLYRLLGQEIGQGYERAKSRTLFRDFINASGSIDIGEKEITVRFQKRAHNPLLLHARLDRKPVKVPWLGNKTLRLVLG